MPDSLRRLKADVFQALAHPTRIAIIELLGNRELSAGDLIEELGMEQAFATEGILRARSVPRLIWINDRRCRARPASDDPKMAEQRYFYLIDDQGETGRGAENARD